ncbi:hypothetical protein ABTX81_05455 [Kitasatospora sp. NPDC097605]|uniref:hypothetical protein n=1 Tax=Kitasatospora sp. NPDC097605 TaxID=3157226 RepID=UPI0033214662
MTLNEQRGARPHAQVIVPSFEDFAFTNFPAPSPSPLPNSVYFIDDSGNRDISAFGFIRVPQIDGWATADAAWTVFLKELELNPHFVYTPNYKLHAVDLLAGRGRLLHPAGGSAPTPRQRNEVATIVLRGLRTLSQVPNLTVGAVYRRGATREDLYADLVDMINNRHALAGSSCQLIVDGNGTEQALRSVHDRLPTDRRHVLGDPLLAPARSLPLLQAADFVAHTAYQAAVQLPHRAFMSHWYRQVFPEPEALLDLGEFR